MVRLPRYIFPDHPQHVILRGNNRAEIFRAEADYRFYLEKLALACTKHGCDVHAYVLMTNHVHLLMMPNEPKCSAKPAQNHSGLGAHCTEMVCAELSTWYVRRALQFHC